jgi:signal transduction histidine kinase
VAGAVLDGGLETGVEVIDLHSDASFAARRLHVRDVAVQMEGMRRLARAFVESPETILQELSNAAVDLCGADSAGISIEREEKTEESYYQWVAASGEYAGFLNATLPRYPSACGICLERGQPQLFRVTQDFFDTLGVVAPTVTDGILIPWQVEEMRGTIWVVAHGRTEAFDGDDLRMMQVLAEFAAMGVRQQRLQRALMEQARVAAVSAMTNELAHQINNPLQSLTNLVYLAAAGESGGDAKALGEELSGHVLRLSVLVKKLLALPINAIRSK